VTDFVILFEPACCHKHDLIYQKYVKRPPSALFLSALETSSEAYDSRQNARACAQSQTGHANCIRLSQQDAIEFLNKFMRMHFTFAAEIHKNLAFCLDVFE